MKLPIYLHIEEDTVWTTYKSERDAISNLEELKTFVKRWENLLTGVKEELLTEEILTRVKSEKLDVAFDSAKLIAEIVIPAKTMVAMLIAHELVVPLNCAFIQMNGGLDAFED